MKITVDGTPLEQWHPIIDIERGSVVETTMDIDNDTDYYISDIIMTCGPAGTPHVPDIIPPHSQDHITISWDGTKLYDDKISKGMINVKYRSSVIRP